MGMTPERLRQRRRERTIWANIAAERVRNKKEVGPKIDLSLYAGTYGGYLPDEKPKARVENICWIVWFVAVLIGLVCSLAGMV